MSGPTTHRAATETPRLLLAGLGPYEPLADNPAVQAVERLVAEGWSPRDAYLFGRVAPVVWDRASATIAEAVEALGCDGVLLLAVSKRAEEVRVEMRAQNRVSRRRVDAEGQLWPHDRILPTGPGVVRATAPVAELVQAIKDAGLPARASSDCGDYIGNFTLYRLLAEAAPQHAIGCVALPAALPADAAARAVKAACEAFAARLGAHRSTLVSA